jgi:hypothetical protein
MQGKHTPALLGGLLIGVLSSVPVVSSANACCCLWVLVGGVLTAYLKQQNQPEPLETADAVLAGLLAGLIGAVIASIGNLLVLTVMGPVMQESMQQAFEQMQDLPPEMRDMVMRLTSGRNMVLLGLAINLPVFAIFGMLGSLLGMAMFKKKLPPSAPPPPAPTLQT